MDWKLLLLFFAIGAAVAEDYPDSYNPECMNRLYSQCDLEVMDTEFPKTKEELQEVCKVMQEYAACAVSILDKCEVSDEMAKPIYTAQKVFRNICDESSNLFQVVQENLECIGDNLEYFQQPCPLTPEETQDLNDVVNAFSAADEEAYQNADMCLESLSRIGCIVSKVSKKCGDQAADALLEVFQQLDKPFERCAPGVKENLSLVVGIIDIEEELAEDLAEMKKKKR